MSLHKEQNIKLSDIDNAPLNIQEEADAVESEALGDLQNRFTELQERFTLVADENFQLKEEIDALKRKIRTTELLDDLIQPYASKAYSFMCYYCGFSGVVLLLHGRDDSRFKLPESVLQILVGSTAVTVIGLVGMVLTGVFVGARRGS